MNPATGSSPVVRSIEQVIADVERRLARTWWHALARQGSDDEESPEQHWPHPFPLGRPTTESLLHDFAALLDWAATWRAWAGSLGITLRTTTRRVHGTDHVLPTHLVVLDVDLAAQVVGEPWPGRLDRGRANWRALAERFPQLAADGTLAETVRAVDGFAAADVDLLMRAGQWFATHDAAGLTPRQVPIEGLHAKWLNTRRQLVSRLAGRDDLGLAPPHPPRVHFTYLDPGHRAGGGRWHDAVTIGDAMVPAYRPELVIISENKDTALHFPARARAVSVEGVGRGAGAIAAVDWLAHAPTVVYWGDMDAAGLEILNEFRAAGIAALSMFMNPAAYARWERFGATVDPQGRPLEAGSRRPVPHLTDDERRLYESLTDPAWPGVRRIEQERIPLTLALAEAERLLTQTLGDHVIRARS